MLLLSDVMATDAAEFSVSQQTDLLFIFGAKDCRANWIANNSLQGEFLKICANKAWLLVLRD